jgi:hypothetical protein
MGPDHTLIVLGAFVMLCMAVGVLYDRHVPYFPIEISRTCAGKTASSLFGGGAVLSWLAFDWTKYSYWTCLAWVGFVLLAVVPDSLSVELHMLGVALMGVGAIGLCFEVPDTCYPVALCFVTYVLRIVAKTLVVIQYEKTIWEWDRWYDPTGLLSIKERSLDIMFGRGDAPHDTTRVVFESAAIAQWVLLLVLAHPLLSKGYPPQ